MVLAGPSESKYALHAASTPNANILFILLDFRAQLLSYDNEPLAWVLQGLSVHVESLISVSILADAQPTGVENASHLSHLARNLLKKTFESTFCSVGMVELYVGCSNAGSGSVRPGADCCTTGLPGGVGEVETGIPLLNSARLAGSSESRSYEGAYKTETASGLFFCSLAPRDAPFTTASEPLLSKSATDSTWSTNSEQGPLGGRIYPDCHSRFLFPELLHFPYSPAASAPAEPSVPTWH